MEPSWPRATQAGLWSWAFAVFAGLCAACAWRVWRRAPPPPRLPPDDSGAAEPTRARSVGYWIGFPAVGSLLLAAITNKLTVDVAPVPFLWVLPLALYLLSFILCFDHARWYARGAFTMLLAAGGGAVAALLHAGPAAPLGLQLAAYSALLFIASVVCHGEVYRLRPAPSQLTRFYLWLAAGGVAGTLFAAVIAPRLYNAYYEVQIGLVALVALLGLLSFQHRDAGLPRALAAGALLALPLIPAVAAASREASVPLWRAYGEECQQLLQRGGWAGLAAMVVLGWCFREKSGLGIARAWRREMSVFVLLLAAVAALLFVAIAHADRAHVVAARRNFYGALRVLDRPMADPQDRHLELWHGVTVHGTQFTDVERSHWPTAYYGHSSGAGLALDRLVPQAGRTIGLVGLGAGTLASYGRRGDRFTFYEINPAVIALARAPFSFLRESAADIDVVAGEARLALAAEVRRGGAAGFDVLVLDAFNSDAIPVHLLTVEAMEIYLARLKPNGLIAVHLTNRHLDLRGVMVGLARHFRLDFVIVEDAPKREAYWLDASRWCLLTRDPDMLRPWLPASADARRALEEQFHPVLWTDDRSSLLSVLR